MQRYLTAMLIGLGLWFTGANAQAQTTPAPCPSDVRAAIAAACPCGQFRNHGQYMKCVGKQVKALRVLGCDVTQAARCAALSICGKPHGPIVCCFKGRPRVTAADQCAAKGGTPQTVNSPCDATCTAPATP